MRPPYNCHGRLEITQMLLLIFKKITDTFLRVIILPGKLMPACFIIQKLDSEDEILILRCESNYLTAAQLRIELQKCA